MGIKLNYNTLETNAHGKNALNPGYMDGAADFVYTVFVSESIPYRISCSGDCERVTGYTQAEMESDRDLWLSVVPEEDRELVTKRNVRLFAGDRPEAIKHKIIRKDGRIRMVENASVPVYGIDGRDLLFDFIIRDITEDRIHKDESAGKLASIRAVLDAITEGAFLVSSAGIVLEANEASIRILNLFRDDVVGAQFSLPWAASRRENESAYGHEDVYAAIRRNGELKDYVYEMCVPEMPLSLIRVNVKSLNLDEIPLRGSIVTFSDISWIAKVEREERRLAKQLAELNETRKGGYITACSHCKKARSQNGEWVQIESLVTEVAGLKFTHGICPSCGLSLYGELYKEIEKDTGSSG